MCIRDSENGDLITTDTWADYENPNVGYSVGTDNKYAGVLGGMLLLRQKYPNMKIGISVGGWTRSGDFPKLAASEKTRKNFANNVAKFVHYYGYDFVDIDWEYPTAIEILILKAMALPLIRDVRAQQQTHRIIHCYYRQLEMH